MTDRPRRPNVRFRARSDKQNRDVPHRDRESTAAVLPNLHLCGSHSSSNDNAYPNRHLKIDRINYVAILLVSYIANKLSDHLAAFAFCIPLFNFMNFITIVPFCHCTSITLEVRYFAILLLEHFAIALYNCMNFITILSFY